VRPDRPEKRSRQAIWHGEQTSLIRSGDDTVSFAQRISGLPLFKLEWPTWTFAGVEGIEPTNNDAEQVLRHAVPWRKSSGGTDSEAGSRFVE